MIRAMSGVVVPHLPTIDAELVEMEGLAIKPKCEICGELATYKITFDINDDNIQMLFYCEDHVEEQCAKMASRLENYFGKMHENARNGMI